ncbi:phage tail assembly chaperone [Hoeflea sp.]|uniref:phage tail assembly chaperone n=1 Tax=Hoeflea sp. TaxID=1940281 RepID=UPI00374920FB
MTKPERALFPWASVIRFGLGRLRLSSDAFWALSLPELVALIGPQAQAETATRERLAALMALFPDGAGPAPDDNADPEDPSKRRDADD